MALTAKSTILLYFRTHPSGSKQYNDSMTRRIVYLFYHPNPEGHCLFITIPGRTRSADIHQYQLRISLTSSCSTCAPVCDTTAAADLFAKGIAPILPQVKIRR